MKRYLTKDSSFHSRGIGERENRCQSSCHFELRRGEIIFFSSIWLNYYTFLDAETPRGWNAGTNTHRR